MNAMDSSSEEKIERQIKRRTFISFSVFGLMTALGITAWSWFRSLSRSNFNLNNPTRKVLGFNEKVNNTFFSHDHLAKTYPASSAVRNPKVNGRIGLPEEFNEKEWTLQVEASSGRTFNVSIEEIKQLPKKEIVFEFKCIEGWSQIMHYGGVLFSDFLSHFQAGSQSGQPISLDRPDDLFSYAGLETPDGKYYVGLDMKSVLHPQTILCYELNGEPLPTSHGAPLRLLIPVKYGVKNLKRIGRLFFSDSPPRDYWHERGYDYDLTL